MLKWISRNLPNICAQKRSHCGSCWSLLNLILVFYLGYKTHVLILVNDHQTVNNKETINNTKTMNNRETLNNQENIKKETPKMEHEKAEQTLKQPKHRFRHYSWKVIDFFMPWLFGLFYFSLYIWARGATVTDVFSQLLVILGLWDYFCVLNITLTQEISDFLQDCSNFWSLVKFNCRFWGFTFLQHLEKTWNSLVVNFEQLMEFIKNLIKKP